MFDYHFQLILKFLADNAGWIILHSLLWNGEIQRDEDLPFPFNIIARLLKGENNTGISLKEKESKDDGNYISSVNSSTYDDRYISANNRISGSSLSEISLNNLYNFLTNPQNAAGSLVFGFCLVTQFQI